MAVLFKVEIMAKSSSRSSEVGECAEIMLADADVEMSTYVMERIIEEFFKVGNRLLVCFDTFYKFVVKFGILISDHGEDLVRGAVGKIVAPTSPYGIDVFFDSAHHLLAIGTNVQADRWCIGDAY